MSQPASQAPPRYVWFAGLAAAFSFTGLLMFRPLVSIEATRLGASSTTVGLIMAGFAFFPLFLALPMGGLVDRYGIRPFVFWGSIGLSLSIFLYVWHPSLAALAIGQVAAGTAQLAMIVSTQTVSTRVPRHAGRERALGLYTLFVSAGQTVGTIPGGILYDTYGYGVTFAAAGATALLPLLLVWAFPTQAAMRETAAARDQETASAAQGSTSVRSDENAGADHDRRGAPSNNGSLTSLLRIDGVQVAMLSSFSVIFALGVRSTFYPLYVHQGLGLSATVLSILLACRGLASIAVRAFIPAITRMFGGRHRAVWVCMAVTGLALGVTPWTRTVVPLVLVSLVTGAGIGIVQPLSMLAVADATSERIRGRAMGLRLTGNRFASLSSPIVFGAVVAGTDYGGGFIVGGLALLAAAGLAYRLRHAFG